MIFCCPRCPYMCNCDMDLEEHMRKGCCVATGNEGFTFTVKPAETEQPKKRGHFWNALPYILGRGKIKN